MKGDRYAMLPWLEPARQSSFHCERHQDVAVFQLLYGGFAYFEILGKDIKALNQKSMQIVLFEKVSKDS